MILTLHRTRQIPASASVLLTSAQPMGLGRPTEAWSLMIKMLVAGFIGRADINRSITRTEVNRSTTFRLIRTICSLTRRVHELAFVPPPTMTYGSSGGSSFLSIPILASSGCTFRVTYPRLPPYKRQQLPPYDYLHSYLLVVAICCYRHDTYCESLFFAWKVLMNATTEARGIAARSCDDVMLKVAATRSEREATFRLIYNAYKRSALCEPNRSGLRFTLHQMLPTTDILIARMQDEIICTLSLARDCEHGLPLEELYAEEVAQRRAQGLRLAEVTCLADRRSDPRRFFRIFCDLSRLMVQLAERANIDQVLVAVHPRHAAMYRRYMSFTQFGEMRRYSKVRGNPAVALCLDLNEIQANRPPRWNQFFGEQLPDHVLQHQPISAADRDYFIELESCDGWSSDRDISESIGGLDDSTDMAMAVSSQLLGHQGALLSA